ncbi:MAG: hypothetical protein HQL54_01485 [Magnetococcales bacterium]|nr:hypothetical protein [Magnetococcales bacterium]
MRLASWNEMTQDKHSFDVNPFVGLLSLTVGPILAVTAVLMGLYYLVG